jgi:hypothetical protein
MSSSGAHTHFEFDPTYKRYLCRVYDCKCQNIPALAHKAHGPPVSSQQWNFSHWMDSGWTPSGPAPSSGHAIVASSSGNPYNQQYSNVRYAQPSFPQQSANSNLSYDHNISIESPPLSKGKGKKILGTYAGPSTLHYSELDPCNVYRSIYMQLDG